MKVKDLIKKLQTYNENNEVVLSDKDFILEYTSSIEVESVKANKCVETKDQYVNECKDTTDKKEDKVIELIHIF